MLRTILVTAIAFLSAGLTSAASGIASVNAPAPSFLLSGTADRQLTLRTFARKPLVINVFASWCPPCRQELPGIVAAARSAHGSVAFLGVDEQEPVEIGTRFARGMKIPYPIGFDTGQFAASYGAQALPVTIFIDARGTVRAIHRGPISGAELQRRIAAIVAPR